MKFRLKNCTLGFTIPVMSKINISLKKVTLSKNITKIQLLFTKLSVLNEIKMTIDYSAAPKK